MRALHRVLLGLVTLIAASGTTARPQPYDVTIVPEFGERQPSNGPLLLTDSARNYPLPQTPSYLQATIVPAPPELPSISWTATGTVDLRLSQSFGFGPPRLTDVVLDRASRVGPFTVTALIGSPVNVKTTIAGFAYERLALGCAAGNSGAAIYDAEGTPHYTERPEDADIYMTGPMLEHSAVWDNCSSAFHDSGADHFTLHVPGGGIVLKNDESRFTAIDVRAWRGSTATSFDVLSLHGTLLWRTREGRLVKTLASVATMSAFAGPTLTADSQGVFADTLLSRRAAIIHERLDK